MVDSKGTNQWQTLPTLCSYIKWDNKIVDIFDHYLFLYFSPWSKGMSVLFLFLICVCLCRTSLSSMCVLMWSLPCICIMAPIAAGARSFCPLGTWWSPPTTSCLLTSGWVESNLLPLPETCSRTKRKHRVAQSAHLLFSQINLDLFYFKNKHNMLTCLNPFQNKSPLHTVNWLRVVLDEGHIIRNPNALMSKAVLSLKAQRRWILSGILIHTP